MTHYRCQNEKLEAFVYPPVCSGEEIPRQKVAPLSHICYEQVISQTITKILVSDKRVFGFVSTRGDPKQTTVIIWQEGYHHKAQELPHVSDIKGGQIDPQDVFLLATKKVF